MAYGPVNVPGADIVKKKEGLPYSLSLTMNGSTSTYKGTSSVSKTWYAPTVPGAAGQVLTSNGSGAPTWEYAVNGNLVITVAASDAPDSVKAISDYVCDGVKDEEEINSAFKTALQNSVADYNNCYGVTVQLSEGLFNIGSTIYIHGGSAFTYSGPRGRNVLRGVGGGTILKRMFNGGNRLVEFYASSIAMISNSSNANIGLEIICDLMIDGNNSVYNTATYTPGIVQPCIGSSPMIVKNVSFINCEQAIAVTKGDITVTECFFDDNNTYAFFGDPDWDSNGATSGVRNDINLLFYGNIISDTTTVKNKIQITLDAFASDSNHSNFSNINIFGNRICNLIIKGSSTYNTSVLNSSKVNVVSNKANNVIISNVDCAFITNNHMNGWSDGKCSYINDLIFLGNCFGYCSFDNLNGCVINNNSLNSSHNLWLGSNAKNVLCAYNKLNGNSVSNNGGSTNIIKNNIA